MCIWCIYGARTAWCDRFTSGQGHGGLNSFLYIYIFWETEPNKFVGKYQRVVQTKITSEIGQSFCRSGWDWSEYCYLKLQWTQFMSCLGDIEDTNLQQFSITISIFLVSYIMKLKKDNVI